MLQKKCMRLGVRAVDQYSIYSFKYQSAIALLSWFVCNIYMRNLKLLKSVWHSFEIIWTTRHNTRIARHDHTTCKLYCDWRNSSNVTSPLHRKLSVYPVFRDFSKIECMCTTVCTRCSSLPLLQIGTPGYEAIKSPKVSSVYWFWLLDY